MVVIHKKVDYSFSEDLLKLFSKLTEMHGSWTEALTSIRATLFKLLITYIRSEKIELESQKTRSDIAFYMYLLHNLMCDLMPYYTEPDNQFNTINNIMSSGIFEHSKEIRDMLIDLTGEYIKDSELNNERKEIRTAVSWHIMFADSILKELDSFCTEESYPQFPDSGFSSPEGIKTFN